MVTLSHSPARKIELHIAPEEDFGEDRSILTFNPNKIIHINPGQLLVNFELTVTTKYVPSS